MKKGDKITSKTAQDYRDEIMLLHKEKKFLKAHKINLCFLKDLQNKNIKSSSDDMWACYLNLGISSKNMKEYKMSERYTKLSLNYAKNGMEYINSRTVLFLIYKNTDNIDKANHTIVGLLEKSDQMIYELTKDSTGDIDLDLLGKYYLTKASILNNKGTMNSDLDSIHNAIELYTESIEIVNIEKSLIINKLDKCYKNIFNICIEGGQYLQAQKALSKIENQSMKQEIRNNLLYQPKKVVGIL